MCGRFTLKSRPADVAELFTVLQTTLSFDPPAEINPNYNVAPTQDILAARQVSTNRLEFATLRWGLVPFWAKDLKIGSRMLNARSETAATKPSFRAAFKKRRCLVVADGFYEWQKLPDKSKQPFYITMAAEQPFCFAGLWESWGKGDQEVQTCTILTTEANSLMEPIHDRMPVILETEDFATWLDPDFHETETLQSLMKPFDSGELKATPVSTFVNKVANNSKQCIKPV